LSRLSPAIVFTTAVLALFSSEIREGISLEEDLDCLRFSTNIIVPISTATETKKQAKPSRIQTRPEEGISLLLFFIEVVVLLHRGQTPFSSQTPHLLQYFSMVTKLVLR
jgi:hypothetical protein